MVFIKRRKPVYNTHVISNTLVCFSEKRFFQKRNYYLVRGVYGNFMIGVPLLTDDLKEVVRLQGGVFRILPVSAQCLANGSKWFNFTGCSFIIPGLKPSESYPFPVIAPDDYPIPGVDILESNNDHDRFQWRFRIHDSILSTPGLAAPGDLILGDKIPAASLSTANLEPNQGKTTESSSSILSRLLSAQPRLVIFPHSATRSLIAFDDIEFERHDYEGLSPLQRQQLHNTMLQVGFERKSGHIYSGHGIKLALAKAPRSLGSSLDPHIPKSSNIFQVVTATQGAYLIATQSDVDKADISEQLVELCHNIPVNIRKLNDLNRPDNWDTASWRALCKKLDSIQQETSLFYRKNRVKGLLGKRKKPAQISET